MKKRLILVCVVAIFSLLFTIFASAHSGKTDSNGGHYNHSTGEYHYHHGYSAHQHYDMNGDGVRDCPYEFKDKTNHSNTSNNNYTSNNDKIEVNKNIISELSNELSFGEVLLIILKIIGISLMLLLMGSVIWSLLYGLLLSPLILWFCKTILKININESTVNKVSIITIVVIVITIASIVVLKAEGLL